MSGTLPTFSSPCLAPDHSGQNAILFGVSSGGQLEAHAIDLSQVLSPTSTLITSIPAPANWDAKQSLGCYAYVGEASPAVQRHTLLVQFGSTTQLLFHPNGTFVRTTRPAGEAEYEYNSPRLFSVVGSTAGVNWYAVKTSSSWRGMRIDAGTETRSQVLPGLGSDQPLLSVGTVAQDIANYGNGFVFTFDSSGTQGSVNRVVANKRPSANLTAAEPLMNLSKAIPINMNNNSLTLDAIPVVSVSTAFVIDKGPGGVVAVYMIDPRSSAFKLELSSVKGPLPPFMPNQAVVSLNSKLMLYGGDKGAGPTNGVHVFDIILGTWMGPSLFTPLLGNSSSGSGISAGIIGGIVAAVVVIGVVVGIVIYRIRRKKAALVKDSQAGAGGNLDNKDTMIKLMQLENKSYASHPHSTSSSPTTPPAPKHVYDSNETLTSEHGRKTRPHAPSRQQSMASVRSARSVASSHISLFPASTGIYLVDSPSQLPPTPMLPSAYTSPIPQRLQHIQRHPYMASSTPSRKGSTYNVNVPNDYDDRQPLHRQESPDDMSSYQQQQQTSTASSSGSATDSWTARPRRKQKEVAVSRVQRDSRLDTRSLSQPSSQPTSPAVKSASGRPRHSRQSTEERTALSGSSSGPSQPSTPRQRKKKLNIAVGGANVEGQSPLSPPLTSPTNAPPSFQRNETRDSGTYKVEYKEPGVTAAYTPIAFTLPMPPTSPRHTNFNREFPLLPSPSSARIPSQSQSQSRPPKSSLKTPPSPSSQTTVSPRDRQQQQQQLQQRTLSSEDPTFVQSYPQHQQQHQQQHTTNRALSVKTPKLASLPRPIPQVD